MDIIYLVLLGAHKKLNNQVATRQETDYPASLPGRNLSFKAYLKPEVRILDEDTEATLYEDSS